MTSTQPLEFLPGYSETERPLPWHPVVAATPTGLVGISTSGDLPTVDQVDQATIDDLRYIGTLKGIPVWAGTTSEGRTELVPWHAFARAVGAPLNAAIARGVYDVRWRHTHRFCGECGGPLEACPGFPTRRCPRCTTLRFVPQALMPVVVIRIRRDDEILLVRHSYGPADMWAFVAGYVDPGETLEAAVIREAWEEVRLPLADIRYVTSLPWSLDEPEALLMLFCATCPPEIEPRVDGVELVRAKWFSRDEIRALPRELLPSDASFAWTAIQRFLAETPGSS